jgi:hypothetical protein
MSQAHDGQRLVVAGEALLSFSIEPRAPVSKKWQRPITAALIFSLPGTTAAAKASKTKPGKAQSSAARARE